MYEIRVLCFVCFRIHSDEESHKRDWKNSEHHPVKRAKSRSRESEIHSELKKKKRKNYAKQSHRRSTSAMSAAQITSYMLKL